MTRRWKITRARQLKLKRTAAEQMKSSTKATSIEWDKKIVLVYETIKTVLPKI